MKTEKLQETYQLYYRSTCPYCIKTRLVLWRMGVHLPLRNIGINKKNYQSLVKGGGGEQVPCLRIEKHDGKSDDGIDGKASVEWLYESGEIINYFKKRQSR